jgi:hypothetical protein
VREIVVAEFVLLLTGFLLEVPMMLIFNKKTRVFTLYFYGVNNLIRHKDNTFVLNWFIEKLKFKFRYQIINLSLLIWIFLPLLHPPIQRIQHIIQFILPPFSILQTSYLCTSGSAQAPA